VMESIWDVWRVWDEGIVRACGTDWYCEIWQQAFVIVLMDFQNDQMGVRVECLPTLREQWTAWRYENDMDKTNMPRNDLVAAEEYEVGRPRVGSFVNCLLVARRSAIT
jgi:hypothetical protein